MSSHRYDVVSPNQISEEQSMSKVARMAVRIGAWLKNGQPLYEAVQALCALIVTALAIWGMFFTNIPDQLIGQLRSDIIDAREELIDVRRSRRAALDSTLAVAHELVQVRAQLATVYSLLEESTDTLQRLQHEKASLQQERLQYFNNTREVVLEAIKRRMAHQLSIFLTEAQLVHQRRKYIDWIKDGERLVESYSSGDVPPDLAAKWRKSVPPDWESHLIVAQIYLEESYKDLKGGPPTLIDELEVYTNIAASFSRRLASKSQPKTGTSLLQFAIDDPAVMLLLPQDRSRISAEVMGWSELDPTLFGREVELRLDHLDRIDEVEAQSSGVIQVIKALADTLDLDIWYADLAEILPRDEYFGGL